MKKNVVMWCALGMVLVLTGGLFWPSISHAAEKKMKLSSKKIQLEVGQKKKIQVKNKKGKKVTWKSSKKKIASVSKKGMITAKKAGKTTVKATVKLGKKKKLTLYCKVTVVAGKRTKDNGSSTGSSTDSSTDSSSSTDSKTTTGSTDTPSVSQEDLTPDKVYGKLTALKSQYPNGTSWDGSKTYNWKGGIYTGGAGCVAFAFMLSDAAFGTLPARKITISQTSLDQVRVGDIIRYLNDTHSVVVLEVKEDSFVVAEGNYNKSVHWGRSVSFDEVKKTGTYIITRYPT